MPLCQALGEIRLARLTRALRFFLLILCIVVLEGCAPRLPLPTRRQPQGILHVVKSGENLFRIGKAYDVPYRELARINRISDPHQIRAGQRIFVPGATRRLPVEIITPSEAAVERSRHPDLRAASPDGFLWPIHGAVSSEFGPRGETFHDGIDIGAPEGTPIRAIEKGVVLYSDQLRGYGNLVIVRHPGGFVSVYAHNRANLVREGQEVKRGEVIAEVGSTGRVSGPHLHFEIRKDNIAQDPLYYLPEL
jgi:murein DD-endopeptidase MepM/ murein hydrolase activator NlpD